MMAYPDPEQRRAARQVANALEDLSVYLGQAGSVARDTELAHAGNNAREHRVVLLRHLAAQATQRLQEIRAALPPVLAAPWPDNLPAKDMRDVRYPAGWPSDWPRVR